MIAGAARSKLPAAARGANDVDMAAWVRTKDHKHVLAFLQWQGVEMQIEHGRRLRTSQAGTTAGPTPTDGVPEITSA